MSELENKIHEYLENAMKFTGKGLHFGDEYRLAKDLAEIAEKDYEKKYDGDIKLNNDLIRENTTLKKQIEGIRYLDRKEVEKIIEEYREWIIKDKSGFLHNEIPFWNRREKDKAITTICNLVIKPIIGEKIINEEPIDYSSDKPVKLIKGYEKLNKDEMLNNKDISNQPPNPVSCKNPDCYDKEGNIIKGGEDE